MNEKQHYDIFLFTALPCEAKALIAEFSLKRDTRDTAFAVYKKPPYCLTISGLGKNAMAAAVAYTLASVNSTETPILVNLGIAGHKELPLGEAFIANKITDNTSEKTYYPPLVYQVPCATMPLQTLSNASTDYPADTLYDMEAAAFYEIAVKFSTTELIQSLKIVSDNATNPTKNITAERVSNWIQQKIPLLRELLEALQALSSIQDNGEPENYQLYLQWWHFTASEKVRLKKRLLTWEVLQPEQTLILQQQQFNRGRECLLWLDRLIAKQYQATDD